MSANVSLDAADWADAWRMAFKTAAGWNSRKMGLMESEVTTKPAQFAGNAATCQCVCDVLVSFW
jgi:hypothetical protein